jgi:hypothetical protein
MQMWTMSDEEWAEDRRKIGLLYESSDIEDKICAILRDTDIGGTGLHLGVAKTKSAAIMELLETKSLETKTRKIDLDN